MERFRAALFSSLSAKVLMPVAATMVVLLVLTAWTVNRLMTQQFQSEAARSLATADAVFQNSQKLFIDNLRARFRNMRNEPRFRALFQAGKLEPDHTATIRREIENMPSEQDVDVVLFTSARGELLAHAKRDPHIAISEFETSSSPVFKQALKEEEAADTILVGDRLFDVVSVPVFSISGELIGTLTFGSEIGNEEAQNFKLVTHSEIVLLANGRVIASTLNSPELYERFVEAFEQSNTGNKAKAARDMAPADHHYFCSAGKFRSLTDDGRMGYLLLSSYEQQLGVLHAKRETLLFVSGGGILLGTLVIWFFVRRATKPLRDLRDSAEAVGRGDFSRRVEVTSGDECGELAWVFNQMTENVKRSRDQLEATVETLKTTQAQLVQSEKLSGIGEFVAGVAHELNNPLTSVMGFSELLKKADGDPRHQRHLDMIHKSAVRCQKIVQNLLSFARRHPPERKLSNVNELVEAAVDFLHYQLRTSNIEVITNFEANLPEAMVDPHQLQQVFLNLVNNARQAMEARQPKGTIWITTETAGENVRLTFRDNGPGISEQNVSKVFDPFFTTKEVGKGTGLGLSLCYGIVKEHGGSITVRSKAGQGATFVVELPFAHGVENAKPQPSPGVPALPGQSAQPAVSREGLGKRILVIDDEEPILQMVGELLSQQGYQVDLARDGEAGLRQLSKTVYDLALCDWKMPGLNGQEVYERIRAANPSLSERMIFMTGDLVNDRTQSFLQERRKVCLCKPFSLTEFRDAVGKALTA